MKRLLLGLIVIFGTVSVKAQIPAAGGNSIKGRISGVILDSLSGKPVDYATVSLGRSGSTKNINGSLTDDKGSFKIENVAAGAYRVTISFLGYNTKIIDPVETTPGKPDLNLGRISLSPNRKMLGEIVVEGQAAVIENKIDRIVYNAEKDVAIAGGTAADVLRKVPLLSVDTDGKISLRGSEGVRVLINGKPSGAMAANVGDALKSIPADQIKNVEVITSPSAKYDAEGTSGIINIITKKNNLAGINGSVNAGLGTRQNSGNMNLNARTGRLGVTANGGGFYSWPAKSLLSFERVNASDGTRLVQTGESETDRLATNGSIGADYDFNSFNSISSNLRFNWFETGVDGYNLSQTLAGVNSYDFTRNTDNQIAMNGIDWSNDFVHKFRKQGHEISFAYQLSKANQNNDYTSIFSNNPLHELGANNNDQTENTIQADYVLPLKKVTLEVGGKTILRDILSEAKTQNFDPSSNAYTAIAGRNYDYDYNQDVFAGYTTLGLTLVKKYSLKAGVRYEATSINGKPIGAANSDTQPFTSDYSNLVPSVVVSRTFKNYSTLKLSYNQRIQRPSLMFLNPFLNSSDLFNQQQGNPGLRPELSHNFDLNYSRFIKSTVINASVYYRQAEDVIESLVRPVEFTNAQGETQTGSLTSFVNIGNNSSVGFNFFGQVNPIKPLTFRGNFNIYSYDISTTNALASAQVNDEVYLMYNSFISATVNLPQGFTVESFLVAHSARRTSQGENPGFNMWNVGMKKELFKKKGSLGITVVDPLNARKNFRQSVTTGTFAQSSNFSLPFRSVGVSFGYRFGSLTTAPQSRRKRINNDDLKQGEQAGQSQ
jgi:ferric enterobactin receptor